MPVILSAQFTRLREDAGHGRLNGGQRVLEARGVAVPRVLDAGSGLPVTTAEVKEGQNVILFVVPADRLILGDGMRCMELMQEIEPVVGKKIVEYIR